jgi:acyl-CoA reductase-like NAD-dependent aldehyde dehydrogenase
MNFNRAVGVAQRIQTGICRINAATVADEPQIPFGGVRGSGYGRFGGPYGIAEFTDVKRLTIESEQHYPFQGF